MLCRKGTRVLEALDEVIAYTGTPWLPAKGAWENCGHTTATSYSQLATLKHVPPTRSTFLQVWY